MLKPTVIIVALLGASMAAPAPEFVIERHVVEVYRRQADISQLLQLYVLLAPQFQLSILRLTST